jgi:hypothetical protein
MEQALADWAQGRAALQGIVLDPGFQALPILSQDVGIGAGVVEAAGATEIGSTLRG